MSFKEESARERERERARDRTMRAAAAVSPLSDARRRTDARPKQLRTFRRTCEQRAPRAWRCAWWPASCWKRGRRWGLEGERKGATNVLSLFVFSLLFSTVNRYLIDLSSRIFDERLELATFFLLSSSAFLQLQCPPPSSRVSRAGAPPATTRRRSRPEAPSSSSSSELRRRRGGAPLLLGARRSVLPPPPAETSKSKSPSAMPRLP